MIGLVQISYYARADRYTYLSQIGLVIAGVWLVADWSAGWKHRSVALGAAMTAILAALMACAWIQTSYWKNSETLCLHALGTTTDNYVAQNNLGYDLLQKGKTNESANYFLSALAIQPSNGQAHFNLGNLYRLEGRTDDAIVQYQKAIQFAPGIGQAHNNLGTALRLKGRVERPSPNTKSPFKSCRITTPSTSISPGPFIGAGRWIRRLPNRSGARNQSIRRRNSKQSRLATRHRSAGIPSRRGQSLRLATQANQLSGGKSPVILGTLAAALAEIGQFSDATATAQQAVFLAREASQQVLAGQLNTQLESYKAGASVPSINWISLTPYINFVTRDGHE